MTQETNKKQRSKAALRKHEAESQKKNAKRI